MHLGCDLSNDQSLIDASAMMRALTISGGEAPFCIVQADPPNTAAVSQIAAVESARHAYGGGAACYVFLQWSAPVTPQADWALAHTPASWPVCCDLEQAPGASLPEILSVVEGFCGYVASRGRRTAAYTSLSWFQGEGSPATYPLWLAEPGVVTPSVPCLIWQYSFNGQLAGVKGVVDLDRWVGAGPVAISFEEFFSLPAPAKPPTPSPEDLVLSFVGPNPGNPSGDPSKPLQALFNLDSKQVEPIPDEPALAFITALGVKVFDSVPASVLSMFGIE